MRFKKGNKVEVLNKKEVPSGSWRCGEIISGNGHNYSIRYKNSSSLTSGAVVDRVTRDAIRPCPPFVQGVESWVAGDVVEVFDDLCWRIATVVKVMGGIYYLVRLLGSCQHLTVHKSNMRLRQSWEDDKWVVIGKGGSCKDLKAKMAPAVQYYQTMNSQEVQADKNRKVLARDDRLSVYHSSDVVSSRKRKSTPPYCSSPLEVNAAKSQKARAIKQPNNQMTGYCEIERSKVNGFVECFLAGSPESNDSETDASSVGSCSITSNRPNKLSTCLPTCLSRDTETFCSDAKSSSSSYLRDDVQGQLPHTSEEELEAGIHRIELHAYRCTLEALYASGPLSWEQEELLTNLRLSLHISNDEHLVEGQGPKMMPPFSWCVDNWPIFASSFLQLTQFMASHGYHHILGNIIDLLCILS